MNLDDQTGAPEAPSDDLRSTIAAAVANQRESPVAEPAAAPEPAKAEPEAKAVAERTDGRDENGRFAAKPDAKPETVVAPDGKPVEAAEAPRPDDAQAATIAPPPGWSPAAKVAFDKADPAIREAVAKREQEINQGFAKLADYKGLDDFADLAKKSGTTVAQAMNNYRAVETALQRDFVGGITSICKQFGVDPRALAGVLTSGAPQAPAATPAASQIDPALIERRAAEAAYSRLRQEQGQQEMQAAIQQFQSDPANRFFDNVRNQMAALMNAGSAGSLKEAYDAACWANPQIRSILISESAAAQTTQPANRAAVATQARSAAKAVSGAPTPGLKPGAAAPDRNASIRDTIVAARDAQLGRA